MLLLHKKETEQNDDSERFSYARKNISDELELIQDQQENIVRVSEELEQAFNQTDKIRELIALVKKVDKTILEEELGGKRKKQSKMLNTMEEVKSLIQQQRYEDIEKLMMEVNLQSQQKIRLSTEELQNLRAIMEKLVELYRASAGLCRLYSLVYNQVKQIYDQCTKELGIETLEEEELSRAGSYTAKIH
jgi:hypothetical protein